MVLKADIKMRISLMATLLMAASFAAYAQEGIPRMFTSEPASAQRGAVITISGDYLDVGCVAKVFLTDGKNDTPVEVTEQAKTALKFKIPDKIAAGRWAVMILTPGNDAKYIEQPVKVLIQD
jgi:ABC-type uncharacterized transport system substrate-binding protein